MLSFATKGFLLSLVKVKFFPEEIQLRFVEQALLKAFPPVVTDGKKLDQLQPNYDNPKSVTREEWAKFLLPILVRSDVELLYNKRVQDKKNDPDYTPDDIQGLENTTNQAIITGLNKIANDPKTLSGYVPRSRNKTSTVFPVFNDSVSAAVNKFIEMFRMKNRPKDERQTAQTGGHTVTVDKTFADLKPEVDVKDVGRYCAVRSGIHNFPKFNVGFLDEPYGLTRNHWDQPLSDETVRQVAVYVKKNMELTGNFFYFAPHNRIDTVAGIFTVR